LLDSVLDKLEQAGGVPKASSTNPQPPQVPANTSAPAATPTTILPDALPDATIAQPYDAQLRSDPASATPLKWSVVIGTLPSGLTMNDGGRISGSPTAQAVVGTNRFTVQCELANKVHASKAISISVKPQN
jgi:Putative Ig domain